MFGFSKYKIVFVTGKGGVGKSVIAAGIAAAEADRGKKVLLAELGTRSFFEKFFQLRYRSNAATLRPGLDVARWDGDTCAREYLVHYLRLEKAADLFLNNKIMGALLKAAPGLEEITLLGKITSGHRHRWHALPYDIIVVDGFATGHFMALLRAPRGVYEAMPVGPMASNCKAMLDILENPEICRYAIVTLPEELPVTETLELHSQIESAVGVSADVICNKTLPLAYAEQVERLNVSPASGAASYLRYLDAYFRRQDAALASLATATENVRTVPYCFQTTPQRLLPAIAAQM
jgi:anion-transporting  ArsA/GET3 family ATPase